MLCGRSVEALGKRLTGWPHVAPHARVQAWLAVVLLGANGGVLTTLVRTSRVAPVRFSSRLWLRRRQKACSSWADLVHYRYGDVVARVREGVAAVFDHHTVTRLARIVGDDWRRAEQWYPAA